MLCTLAFPPASWPAMLPQKFSAATTRTPGPREDVLDPHAVSEVASATASPAPISPARILGIAARPYQRSRLSLVIWTLRPTLASYTAHVPRKPDEHAQGWSKHAQRVLTGAGHQRGGARARIIELLARETCALSAVEIEDALCAEGKSI